MLENRLEETLAFGRRLDVAALSRYLTEMVGGELGGDSLVALLQQYALCDAPLVAPGGRVTGSTGFHLALLGPTGSGKSFAIDDLVRGDPRRGVPAHGLPGRNRYCGGITPARFLRIGAYYSDRAMNFIVPEFNDWFRYPGMVEPLKLALEQRAVRWETTQSTIGPYTFRSFFSVSYNVRDGAGARSGVMRDPYFVALEDRMLMRFQTMTRNRFRAIDASTERLELGEVDFPWADQIRDHLTLTHAIQTGHRRVADRFPRRAVRLSRALYDRLQAVSDELLSRTDPPTLSPRARTRAVRLAASAALVRVLAERTAGPVSLRAPEIDVADQFYREEFAARATAPRRALAS